MVAAAVATVCAVALAACTAGATLPIEYDLGALPGAVRYVATNGSDTTGNGSAGAPYLTLSRAISASAANDSIVVRGGTYREGNLTLNKKLTIIAHPGEVPVFNGAQPATSWTSEGSLRYTSYTPQPVTSGHGIDFPNGVNLTGDGMGKHPDQAWVGDTQLRQVATKAQVTEGTFWVDATTNRLYVAAVDADKGNVEVSQKDKFMNVTAAGAVVEGLRITRFSPSANDYGVMQFQATADNSVLRNVEITDSAFLTLVFTNNGNDFNVGSSLLKVTIARSNWMGISAVYTENLTLFSVKITQLDQFDEFSNSPQSGAIKTSRARGTKVLNSEISNNKSHGLWFDESNVDVDIANTAILDNTGTGVFFEISDDLLMANNVVRSPSGGQPVKLAGASGLKLVNNTLIGGTDPIGIYTDSRSMPGCADPGQPACAGSPSSNRDIYRPRPPTLDWMPRLDLMLNNVVVYPSSSNFCGVTALCITSTNGSAVQPLDKILHQANEPHSGLPETRMGGNVYANGSGHVIRTTSSGNYTTAAAFSTAMAGPPVSIAGLDATSLTGNSWVNPDGTPSPALAAIHSNAEPVPVDADINQYLSAGTRHYGVTFL